MINPFRRSAAAELRQSAAKLYTAAVRQARQPSFYLDLDVPDTADGRYDMIALHVYLLLRRIKHLPEAGQTLGQALFDHMFTDLDRNLREMGVGDLGVGRQVKAMAAAFYGRVAAYDAGLAESDAALAQALARNLYRNVRPTEQTIDAMTRYVRAAAAALDQAPADDLLQGKVDFGTPFSTLGR